MQIRSASLDDAPDILSLRRLAYQSEAELYQEPNLPPLTETLEELKYRFQDHLFLIALRRGRIVGSVRAILQEGTCHIGRLIVHPQHQGRGIGTALMQEIEHRMRGAMRFELFTGHKSEGPLHLYHKLGYREFKRETVSPNVTLVFLEKAGPAPPAPDQPIYLVIHHEIYRQGRRYQSHPMLFHAASSLERAQAYIREGHMVDAYSWWEIQVTTLDNPEWPERQGIYARHGRRLKGTPFKSAVAAYKRCARDPDHHLYKPPPAEL